MTFHSLDKALDYIVSNFKGPYPKLTSVLQYCLILYFSSSEMLTLTTILLYSWGNIFVAL